MQKCMKKRRDWHRRYWKKWGTHAPLIYGGKIHDDSTDSSDEDATDKGDETPRRSPRSNSVNPRNARKSPRRSPRSNSVNPRKKARKSPRRSPRNNSANPRKSPSRSPRLHRTPSIPKKRTRKRIVLDLVDASGSGSDVSKMFDSSASDPSDGEQVCWDCGLTLRSREECYPRQNWGNREELVVRCKHHWDLHMSPQKQKISAEEAELQRRGDKNRDKRKEIEEASANNKVCLICSLLFCPPPHTHTHTHFHRAEKQQGQQECQQECQQQEQSLSLSQQ